MGMNWRAGLQLASTGLRMDRERKREYERADREMAMPMAQLLAQQGMPIPEEILNQMGPMARLLAPKLEEAIRTGKQRELEDYAMKQYYDQAIEAQFREPKQPTGKAATMQQIEAEPWYQAMSPEEQTKIRQKVLMGGGGLDEINQSLAEMRLQNAGITGSINEIRLKQLQDEMNQGKQLPPKVIEDLAKSEDASFMLDNMGSMLKDAVGKGYKWVGPKQGRTGWLKENYAGEQLDLGQADFYALEARIKNAVVKEMTGAQLNQNEEKRILNEIPSRNLPTETYFARIKQSKANIDYLRKRKQALLKQGGYSVPTTDQTISTPVNKTPSDYLE